MTRAVPPAILALWGAVILQARDDPRRDVSLTKAGSVRRALKHWQRDAYAWLHLADDTTGSFIWACELLRIDPAACRTAILNGGTTYEV